MTDPLAHTLIEDFGLGVISEELQASLPRLNAMDPDELGVRISRRIVEQRPAMLDELDQGITS